MSKIQSVRFPTSKYDSKEARAWLSKHDLTPRKPADVTDRYYHYRIRPVHNSSRYRTKKLSNGIQLVLEFTGPRKR